MEAEGQEFKGTLSCVRVCGQPGLLLSQRKKGKGNKTGSRERKRREVERGKEGGGEREGEKKERREGIESLDM